MCLSFLGRRKLRCETLSYVKCDAKFSLPALFQYLLDNVGSANIRLTTEEVEAILKAAEATDLPGARYPPGMQEALQVESPPLESA